MWTKGRGRRGLCWRQGAELQEGSGCSGFTPLKRGQSLSIIRCYLANGREAFISCLSPIRPGILCQISTEINSRHKTYCAKVMFIAILGSNSENDSDHIKSYDR